MPQQARVGGDAGDADGQMDILQRNPRDLAVLLLLAPLLGALNFIIYSRTLFDPVKGKAADAITMFYMMIIIMMLLGSLSSVREIVKERAIYKRERMVSVGVVPYVLSKVFIGFFIATYSAIALFLFLNLAVDLSYLQPVDRLTLFLPFLLGAASGVMWGLLVSAIAPTEERAMLLLIMFLIPQFLLAGGVLPVKEMGGVGPFLGVPTTTKWALGALVTGSQIQTGDCTSAELADCHMPGLAALTTPADRHSLVDTLNDTYGQIFHVNTPMYWGMLAVIIGVVLLTIVVLQKRKDRL